MYHTHITAQGVANTLRHKILDVNHEGCYRSTYHVSRAVIVPSIADDSTAIKLYYNIGGESHNTIVIFDNEFLLTLLNAHTATSNYENAPNVTVTITNDYE